MFSNFSRHVSAAALYPAPTQKAAIAEARALGVMIRREGPEAGEARGFEVYSVGSPESALYAECKAEALALADAIAHDVTANRLSFSRAVTLRGIAESLASRAAKAAGLSAGDIAATVDSSRPRAGFVAFVFTGPHGVRVEHEIDVQTGRPPAAEVLCNVAPAAEHAAEEAAAHVREAEEAAAHVPEAEEAAAHVPEAELAARNAERGPRSLSAAANPDAPKRSPRRMARSRAELMAERKAAELAGNTLAAELAGLSLMAAAGQPARASGSFPLYAWPDGRARLAEQAAPAGFLARTAF